MAAMETVRTKPFQSIRIEAATPVPFGEVLSRLRQSMGDASVPEFAALVKEAANQAEFVQNVEERFVGESGFMLFHEIDHGAWLAKFGIGRRCVRLILGNPLIAITMMRLDITAGLFAPVEVLLTEKVAGWGTIITYVRPSSLILIGENPPLRQAAEALDEKLDALIAKVCA
jgi:uncharacterized protein (DUF302 family)